MTMSRELQASIDAACVAEDDIERLRSLSMQERSQLLAEACRLAMAIEVGKRQMGLPPSEPEPWPQSTWDLLKRHAAASRNR